MSSELGCVEVRCNEVLSKEPRPVSNKGRAALNELLDLTTCYCAECSALFHKYWQPRHLRA